MTTKPYIVLVGMDFSELADRALQEAFELAAQREIAEVHVVTVVPPTVDPHHALAGSALDNQAGLLAVTSERLRSYVQAGLERFAAHAKKTIPARIVSHVRVDTPALGIVQLAAELGATLIVLGTHSRRGVERFLMGSVAESTVRYARCPVLVIPPAEQPWTKSRSTRPAPSACALA